MRALIALNAVVILLPGVAGAEPEPSLWEAELRVGFGVAVTGGTEMSSTSTTPLGLTAIGALAIRDEPRVYAFGGITAETLDRNAVGVTAGVRFQPSGGVLRLAAGGTWMFAPETLWGAVGSAGVCHRGTVGLCIDVQL
ncbi:MAG: hypothetical protein WKG01_40760, partial [Kofleriaceae bacterium]